jgi:hypothetical protein
LAVPWSGYSTAGTWLAGDWDDDGDDDLLHLTTGGSIHLWRFQGGSVISVSNVSLPWTGYSLAGTWLVGDFDGDGDDDIVHLSTGGAIDLWRSLLG